jgi:ceramide glucosyltransferase
MIHSAANIIEIIAYTGAFSSACFYVVCLWGALTFHRQTSRGHVLKKAVQKNGGNFTPAVSILKPLKGIDPQMYESFRSHCLQAYPDYEILFGVHDPADPALNLVEKLKNEFPERAIKVLICTELLGANVKVSNLAQMLPHAAHEYLLANDSDIRVEPDYLLKVISPLAHDSVGMVTCLYRGIPAPTLGSQLESIGVGTDFCPGVLAARLLENGIHFGLGSTLAFRRRDLQAIGGFELLLDYLADDYQLGSRIAATGLKVELSDSVVETYLPAYSFTGFLQHQLRWARAVRDSRRWGYAGLAFTWGLPWAALALIVTRGSNLAWELFAAVVALRFAVAITAGRTILRDRALLSRLWLVPLRDLIAPFVWLASFMGRTISWRGGIFTLRNGKLAPAHRREYLP